MDEREDESDQYGDEAIDGGGDDNDTLLGGTEDDDFIFDAPWGLNEVRYPPLVSGMIAVLVTVGVAVVVGLGLARSGAQSGAVAATVAVLLVASRWIEAWRTERSLALFGTVTGTAQSPLCRPTSAITRCRPSATAR